MADIFDLFAKISKENTAKVKAPIEWLIVGLGNPGRDYVNTRHNAGFMAIDAIAKKKGVTVDRSRFKALSAECEISGKGALLMLPQTYMNLSGEAVREAAQFYKIAPENIIVISDDISLDIGKQRVKRKGSDGGQKGLRSIIYHLQSDAFPRVKVGVGKKPHPDYDLADWVLSDIPQSEWQTFEDSLKRSRDAIELILQGKIDVAMNQYNS